MNYFQKYKVIRNEREISVKCYHFRIIGSNPFVSAKSFTEMWGFSVSGRFMIGGRCWLQSLKNPERLLGIKLILASGKHLLMFRHKSKRLAPDEGFSVYGRCKRPT